MTTHLTERLILMAELTIDDELQPRCLTDRNLIKHYGQLLLDGTKLPPVVVFDDGEVLWLADGFHRLRAHQSLGRSTIAGLVYPGTRLDALRFSLSANATHGKPRTRGDLIRAYTIAKRQGLIAPGDALAVRQLLNCSTTWAFKLTEADRRQGKTERLQRIQELRAAGRSLREIAQALGMPRSTVTRVLKQDRIGPYRPIFRHLEAYYTIPQPDGSEHRVEQAHLTRHQWLMAEQRIQEQLTPLQNQLAGMQQVRMCMDRIWIKQPQLSLEAAARLVVASTDRDQERAYYPDWTREVFR